MNKLDEILTAFAQSFYDRKLTTEELNMLIKNPKQAIIALIEEIIGDEMSIELAFDDKDMDKIEATNFLRRMQRQKLQKLKENL